MKGELKTPRIRLLRARYKRQYLWLMGPARPYVAPRTIEQKKAAQKKRSAEWAKTEAGIAYYRNRQNNPEYIYESKKRHAAYYQKNKHKWPKRERGSEREKELMRAYYLKNREHRIAAQKEWARKNKEKKHSLEMARRARARNNTAGMDANSVFIESHYTIASRLSKCTGIKHHVDHIIPISAGGPHHQNNLRVTTAAINLRKGARLLAA